MSHRVEVMTRSNCPLCDDAVAIVERVCAELGVPYRSVDIDTDPDLRRRFTNEVPVTFVDGRQHDYWRVDEDRLRRALQ